MIWDVSAVLVEVSEVITKSGNGVRVDGRVMEAVLLFSAVPLGLYSKILLK